MLRIAPLNPADADVCAAEVSLAQGPAHPHIPGTDPTGVPTEPKAMLDNPNFDGHERLLTAYDEDTGLRAIVALHSTVLGPAAGGCRLWTYDSFEDGLNDALRLSKGMSYKNAIAKLPLGGGKAVILGPIDEDWREAAFEAFGRIVESLNGTYITAEDVGVSVSDMVAVRKQTAFVSGIGGNGALGGDPSPFTARGVARGIEAMAHEVLGRTNLDGLRIAVQGVGSVGLNLCRELSERGADLIVADIRQDQVDRACDTYGARPADLEAILFEDVDVVAPCALGGVIDDDTAKRVTAPIIAGAANNQLAADAAGQTLFDRNIAYAPDYVINAGGIIAVAAEYLGNRTAAEMTAAVDEVGTRVRDIYRRSVKQGIAPQHAADTMARSIIRNAAGR